MSPQLAHCFLECYSQVIKYRWTPKKIYTVCVLSESKVYFHLKQLLKSSLYKTLYHWTSFQSLWVYSRSWRFSPRSSPGRVVSWPPPLPNARPFLRVTSASWLRCQMLSLVLTGLLPASQRRNSDKVLIRFSKFSLPSTSFFLDLPWFFRLDTKSSVSSLFADVPQSGPAEAKFRFYDCQILFF